MDYATNFTKDIDECLRLCYNKAIDNKDAENVKWFGDQMLRSINQRWIRTYVPPGMLIRK
jgi:hypothetical protein